MHFHAETIAEQAAWVADPPIAVDGVADRNGVDQLPALIAVAVGPVPAVYAVGEAPVVQRAVEVAVADLVPVDRHLDADIAGDRMAA